MNADKIAAELRKGLEGVTPGEWESDSTRSDGSYGGFDAYQVIAPPLYPGGRDVVICDTLNSDATSVAEELDEDGCHSAWDEQGRKNMAHLARCSPANIFALLDAYDERGRLLAEVVEAVDFASQIIMHANPGAFSNGVTDPTGSIDEGNVLAADALSDLLALLSKLKEATDGTR